MSRSLLIALLALASVPIDAAAQSWDVSKAPWDQTKQLRCDYLDRQTCELDGGTCKPLPASISHLTIDFTTNRMILVANGPRLTIRGRAFYPLPFTGNPIMSLLLSDGRMFKFRYGSEPERASLSAAMVGYSAVGKPSVEISRWDCARL